MYINILRASIVAAAVCAGLCPSPSAWAQSATSGAVLTYDDAFFTDAQLATAYDMVQRLPGFVFQDGGNSRGFSGNAGNVLVNGLRPTSKTDDLQSILQRIPFEQVERIDVIRGGAPGIDMQNQPVIANVILKRNDTTAVIATLADTIYGDGNHGPAASVEFNKHVGATIYDVTLSRIDEGQNLSRTVDLIGDGTRIITAPGLAPAYGSARQRGAKKVGWRLNASIATPVWGGNFGANLTLGTTTQNGSIVYGAPPAPASFDTSNKQRNAEFGLNWSRQFGDLNLTLQGLQRLQRSTFHNASIKPGRSNVFDSVKDTGESILRTTLHYRISSSLTAEGGIEGDYNSLKGTSSYLANGAAITLPAANPRVNEQRGDAYAQLNWHITPDILAEAGSRFEYSRLSGQGAPSRTLTFVKPRLFLSWSLNKSSQVRLRIERVVGQLNFSNFIATSDLAGNGVSAGSVDLRPDQRWQFEAAYEYHFWEKGAVVFTYTHEDITDLVDFVPVGGGLDGPGNIPKATDDKYNVETTIPTDRLGLPNGLLQASLTWYSSAFTDPVTGQTRPITNEWDNVLSFSLTQDIASLDSTWKVGVQLPHSNYEYRIAQAEEDSTRAPYVYVNWDYKPRPDLDLQIKVDNAIPFQIRHTQWNYPGPRNLGGIPTIQEVSLRTVPRLFVQLRKTF